MAATDAAVTESVTAHAKKSFSETFSDFLRTAPEKVSKQEIEEALLGKGKGFLTKRDLANRVTVAQQTGLLSKRDGDRLMKNKLAGKMSGPKTRTVRKSISVNGSGPIHARPRGEDVLERVTEYVDDVESLAQRASVDPSITRDALIEKMIKMTTAFNGLLAMRLDS